MSEKNPFHIIGPIGEFPKEGKFCAEDEGKLRAGMTIFKGKIVMNFGKSISFLVMTSDQAREWAELLLKKADELDRTNAGKN